MAERKTYLNDAELGEFRRILLERRELLLESYKSLVEQIQQRNPPGSSGAQSNLPTHQADLALDDSLNDETTQMAEHERDLLVAIDEALQRIENKTYGICQATGRPISKDRLWAKPWAKFSVEYVQTLHGRQVEK